jgi:hypothetical protein
MGYYKLLVEFLVSLNILASLQMFFLLVYAFHMQQFFFFLYKVLKHKKNLYLRSVVNDYIVNSYKLISQLEHERIRNAQHFIKIFIDGIHTFLGSKYLHA